LVYGIVEFVLACAIPMLLQPGMEILGWQWRLIAMLFGFYALTGFALGGVSGMLLLGLFPQIVKHGSNRQYHLIAGLTLSLAFAANLFATKSMAPREYVWSTIALILAALAGWALFSNRRWSSVVVAKPLALSFLLLTFPWVSTALGGHSVAAKILGSTLAFGVIFVLAGWWYGRPSASALPMRRRAIAATSIAILLLTAVLIREGRSAVHANQSFEASAAGRCNVVLITVNSEKRFA
jgi:hypothetical protein